ncbi:MAG: twin-arginine translocase TatA/TatE family subunit, partial [Nitrosopumilus sp.]|nr:twin-arginine translocase TatA/TatE family subunit [Nitrosopumilus sp.]
SILDYSLNIGGSEWMIIIFVALVLILGTGKLPGAAKKLGKVVNEYNKAKNEIQEQMKEVTDEVPKISGPVETEREKLEMIAKSAGIKVEEKTDDELRDDIATKIGQKRKDESEKIGQKRKDESEKK